VNEGYADFRGYRTWYRVTGDPHADKAPLVVLHGGPGCTHDYLDSLTSSRPSPPSSTSTTEPDEPRERHDREAPAPCPQRLSAPSGTNRS
jgi:L-proline amide hydrolase